MLSALIIALLVIWLMLWGIFHLAGGPIHLLLVAGLLLLVLKVVRISDLRAGM